jgi:hypothetical protein
MTPLSKSSLTRADPAGDASLCLFDTYFNVQNDIGNPSSTNPATGATWTSNLPQETPRSVEPAWLCYLFHEINQMYNRRSGLLSHLLDVRCTWARAFGAGNTYVEAVFQIHRINLRSQQVFLLNKVVQERGADGNADVRVDATLLDRIGTHTLLQCPVLRVGQAFTIAASKMDNIASLVRTSENTFLYNVFAHEHAL